MTKKTTNFMAASLLFLCVSAYAAQAPEKHPVFKKYKDTPISSSTLLGLAPKAPEQVEKNIQNFFTANPEIVATALGYEPILDKSFQSHKVMHALLAEKKIARYGSWNYIFSAPEEPNYLIKISGHISRKETLNRLMSTLAAARLPEAQGKSADAFYDIAHKQYCARGYGRDLDEDDYAVLAQELKPEACDHKLNADGTSEPIKGCPTTYQTISRIAHYLLFLDAHARHNFKHIVAPAMYLTHIPGRPAQISDRNYVVVEKKIEGLTSLAKVTPQEGQKIQAQIKVMNAALKEASTSPEQKQRLQANIKKLEEAIKPVVTPQEAQEIEIVYNETGLFAANGRDLMRTPDGKIAIVDWEQPNNSDPSTFFHESAKGFENNRGNGIGEFRGGFKIEEPTEEKQ